jgi:hypothetical protein
MHGGDHRAWKPTHQPRYVLDPLHLRAKSLGLGRRLVLLEIVTRAEGSAGSVQYHRADLVVGRASQPDAEFLDQIRHYSVQPVRAVQG